MNSPSRIPLVGKAVVTAGGLATRLRPLTKATNKHMLPLYDRPVIQHVIETVVASGVTDILVQLTNAFAQPVMQLLEDGSEFGCNICYTYRPNGDSVAKQLANARSFVDGKPFLLVLGDSYFRFPFSGLESSEPRMLVMPLREFDDHRKYAEVRVDQREDGLHVTDITTDVGEPVTGIIQTGAWVFPTDVFEKAERLVAVSKGETMVRHIVREYIDEGRMRATMLPPNSFLDVGTKEALYLANTLARESALHRASAATR